MACPHIRKEETATLSLFTGELLFTVKFLTQRTGGQTQVDAPPETATPHQWRATRGPHTQRSQARRPLRPPPRQSRTRLPFAPRRHHHGGVWGKWYVLFGSHPHIPFWGVEPLTTVLSPPLQDLHDTSRALSLSQASSLARRWLAHGDSLWPQCRGPDF